MPATDQTTADHVDGPAPHTPPAGSSASDLAGDYASRRLGASWALVLGISAGVREHGLILPEIEDPAAVDRYIDEHLAVARLQEVQRQAANITEELTQVGDQPASSPLGALIEALSGQGTQGKAGAAGSSLEDLLGGLGVKGRHHAEPTGTPSAGPSALTSRVRAGLYAKALAAGQDSVPADLWETLTGLASAGR